MKNNTSLIKRTKRKINFTVIGNEILQSKELSFAAKGLLCYILSLPDDWVLHKTWLQKEFKISRHAVDKTFKEIETAGYMHSLEMIVENGKFKGKNYLFYDEPTKAAKLEKFTDAEFPTTEIPTTEKQQLLSTNTNKELTEQNKHSLVGVPEISNMAVNIDREQPLPRWLRGIKGTTVERFADFRKVVNQMAKKENVSDEAKDDLINTYGADDKMYDGYMRFETDRYFDLQLMIRKFEENKERRENRYS